MPIPKFKDLFDDVLEVLSAGEVLHGREVRQRVLDRLDLTEAERAETNPGDGNRANSQVHWAIEFLYRKVFEDLNKPGLTSVEAALIVSRKPDEIWVRLCEDLRIRLAWPSQFGALTYRIEVDRKQL